jgi:hypothetical protein
MISGQMRRMGGRTSLLFYPVFGEVRLRKRTQRAVPEVSIVPYQDEGRANLFIGRHLCELIWSSSTSLDVG